MTSPQPPWHLSHKTTPQAAQETLGQAGVGAWDWVVCWYVILLGFGNRPQGGGTYLILPGLWILLIRHRFLFLKVVAEQGLQPVAALLITLLETGSTAGEGHTVEGVDLSRVPMGSEWAA